MSLTTTMQNGNSHQYGDQQPVEQMTYRRDISAYDRMILDDLEVEEPNIDDVDYSILGESLTTTMHLGPLGEIDHKDITNIKKTERDDIEIGHEVFIDYEDDKEESTLLADQDEVEPEIPHALVNYYDESAMKAAERNALPDSDFGIPRLRAYPLNDAKHVKQAIRMFHHCKEADRKQLASRIKSAIKKFNVDVTVGKNNPLWNYMPKNLRESTDSDSMLVAALGKPLHKRTKEDVIKDHLNMNGPYYNAIFYGSPPDTSIGNSISKLKKYEFMNYFYPSMKVPFQVRIRSVCGGLASNDKLYEVIHTRYPLWTNMSSNIGLKTLDDKDKEKFIKKYKDIGYNKDANWFKANTNEHNHVLYCLRLYTVIADMLYRPAFHPDSITPEMSDIMGDWLQHVYYHYDLYKEAEADKNEKAKLEEIQYLYDLFWDYTDSPYDDHVVNVNIITLLQNMACNKEFNIDMNESEDPDIWTKDNALEFLLADLKMPEDMFLLPDKKKYPIVDQDSVRLAMDRIGNVDKEDRSTFAKNLNRKYKELGCRFAINIDHPYIKYADDNIVRNANQILTEGLQESSNSVVGEDPVGAGVEDLAHDPWYKRISNFNSETPNKKGGGQFDNKDMGPNYKPMQKPDWTQHYSIL